MPFNDALFWFGLTAFGTGLYFLIEANVKRRCSIGVTVVGFLACAYAEYRYYHPEIPAIRLWVILLILTWALLGYSVYIRRLHRLPPSKNVPPPNLVIHSAVYGTGPIDDVLITERLRTAVRDALVVPVDNNLVPRDPAIGKVKRLAVEFSYGNSSIQHASRLEGERLVLPEDSSLPRLRSEVEQLKRQHETVTSPVTLGARIQSLCRELQAFRKEYGPEPEMQRDFRTPDHDTIDHFMETVLPWRLRLQADFRLRFAETLARISDEIRVVTGEGDTLLSNAITTAANSPNGELKAIDEVIERLWGIALKLAN